MVGRILSGDWEVKTGQTIYPLNIDALATSGPRNSRCVGGHGRPRPYNFPDFLGRIFFASTKKQFSSEFPSLRIVAANKLKRDQWVSALRPSKISYHLSDGAGIEIIPNNA